MPLVVTSAAGANSDGYGALLTCDDGWCSSTVPPTARALDRNAVVGRDSGPIDGLNPGRFNFGSDGPYPVGLRSARSIITFMSGLDPPDECLLLQGIVPFSRGFTFGPNSQLFT
jgi:hypothetical protein